MHVVTDLKFPMNQKESSKSQPKQTGDFGEIFQSVIGDHQSALSMKENNAFSSSEKERQPLENEKLKKLAEELGLSPEVFSKFLAFMVGQLFILQPVEGKGFGEKLDAEKSITLVDDLHPLPMVSQITESFDPLGQWFNSIVNTDQSTSGNLPVDLYFGDPQPIIAENSGDFEEWLQVLESLEENLQESNTIEPFPVANLDGEEQSERFPVLSRWLQDGNSSLRDLIKMTNMSNGKTDFSGLDDNLSVMLELIESDPNVQEILKEAFQRTKSKESLPIKPLPFGIKGQTDFLFMQDMLKNKLMSEQDIKKNLLHVEGLALDTDITNQSQEPAVNSEEWPVDSTNGNEGSEKPQGSQTTFMLSLKIPVENLQKFPGTDNQPKPINFEQFAKEFESILQRSTILKNGGTQKLLIRLSPEHLGMLKIELTQTENGLAAKILASSQQAKDLLESQIHGLRQAFIQQNIDVNRIDLQGIWQEEQEFLDYGGSSQERQQSGQEKKNNDSGQAFDEISFEDLLLNLTI